MDDGSCEVLTTPSTSQMVRDQDSLRQHQQGSISSPFQQSLSFLLVTFDNADDKH